LLEDSDSGEDEDEEGFTFSNTNKPYNKIQANDDNEELKVDSENM